MNIGELTATLGIDDSRILTAEKSFKKYGQMVENTMKTAEKSIRRHNGLIEDVEEALTELRDARKGAFSVEEIERYNKKIKEAEGAIKEYEEAGLPAEKQTNNLGESFKKLAGKIIVAAAIWKTLKSVIESTSTTATWFHSVIEGAKTGLDYFMKSIATANFSRFITGLREAIRAGRDFKYAMDEISDISRAYAIEEVDLQNKIEVQRQVMYENDKTSLAAKIKAGEQILTLLKQQADMEIELATKTYQAIAEKTGAKNKLTEDEIKYAIQHYTEIEKVGKEYNALASIMDYVNGQITKGLTVRNDVIEATSKQWVVLNDYNIKSVEDLEQAMKNLGSTAPTAGKLIEALGKMTDAEKDSITEAVVAVKEADNKFLIESRFIFRMIENMRDTSNTEQLKLIEEFYKEASRLHRLYLDQYADDIKNSTKGEYPEQPPRRDYRRDLMRFSDVGTAADQLAAKLKNIAERNVVFGASFDSVGNQLQFVRAGLEDLWERGLRPGIPLVDAHIAAYERLLYIQESVANKTALMRGIMVNAFQGMSNSISDALSSTENTLQAFGKFFGDFIKGMIFRLVAATIAAATLAIVLAMVMPGGISKVFKGLDAASKFGDIFKAGFKSFTGMAGGGTVPPGYPNDTYPALLSSGEKVIPPGKLGSQMVDIQVEDIVLEGDQLRILLGRASEKHNAVT